MSKNDNAHSIRLVDSLGKNVGSDTAKEFEEIYPLSQSANIEKKYEWAKNIWQPLKNSIFFKCTLKK